MAIATPRTVDVLEALGNGTSPLSLADIVAATGIGRASASRLLAPMIERGVVVVSGDPPRYRLGLRCWSLGIGALTQHPVVATALPYLIELARRLNTRVNVSLPEGLDMVFVQAVELAGARLTVQPIYVRTGMLATASGRVAAAFADDETVHQLARTEIPRMTPFTRTTSEVISELPEIRNRGYATTDRERELDLSGIAVPIRDRSGAAVAAVGLPAMGPLSPEFLSGVLRSASDTAADISTEMGLPLRQTRPLA